MSFQQRVSIIGNGCIRQLKSISPRKRHRKWPKKMPIDIPTFLLRKAFVIIAQLVRRRPRVRGIAGSNLNFSNFFWPHSPQYFVLKCLNDIKVIIKYLWRLKTYKKSVILDHKKCAEYTARDRTSDREKMSAVFEARSKLTIWLGAKPCHTLFLHIIATCYQLSGTKYLAQNLKNWETFKTCTNTSIFSYLIKVACGLVVEWKAVVREAVGSNPKLATSFFF